MTKLFSSQLCFNLLRRLLLLPICLLITQCSQPVEEELVIPDGYVGPLIVQINCAGGKPMNIRNGVIKIEFPDDGFVCTSDKSLPAMMSEGIGLSHTRSGKPVSHASMVRLSKNESALCYGDSGGQAQGNLKVDYARWWYGPCLQVNSEKINSDLNDFSRRHFGFKLLR
jgi:hypothetical protein